MMANLNGIMASIGSRDAPYISIALILVPTISIVVYALYLYLLPKPLPGIPYDKAATRSVLGNLPSIQSFGKTHQQLFSWFSQEASRHNSPICQFWFGPFSKPDIILNDAREAQDLLLRRTREFGRSERIADVMQFTTPEFHVALMSEDPRYKRNKALVRDLMSPAFLENISAPEIYRSATYFIEYWQTKMKLANGNTFEAKEDVFGVLADMVSAAAFTLEAADSQIRKSCAHLQQLQPAETNTGGNKTPARVSVSPDGIAEFSGGARVPFYDALERLTEHQGDQNRAFSPVFDHAYEMATDATLRNAYRVAKQFETEQIERSLKRLQSSKAQLSALDHILSREAQVADKEGRKPEYYSQRIYDELLGFYTAGHETSASTLSWAVKHLGVSQDIQANLRAALRKALPQAVLSERQPSALEIIKTSIPYLDAVLEEILRLHPSLPMQNRQAKVDTVILGHRVPKGTTVWIVPHGPSYTAPSLPLSEDLRSETSKSKGGFASWERSDADLDCFRPDRWLKADEENEGGVRFDNQAAPMQSFGGGPRACFGRRMAYMQMKALVSLIVWNFELLPVEGKLSTFAVQETQVAQPRDCYVKLRDALAA